MNLLEKAKSVSVKRNLKSVSLEEMELALGWLRGEVTLKQCAIALKVKDSTNVGYRMGRFLTAAYNTGLLKIVDKSLNE